MTISGSVDKIVYRNSENGYSVMIVDGGRDLGLTTAVGIMPDITEGTTVELIGDFAVNSKFGEQFSVTQVKVCLPTALESIAKYLASGLFAGIGEVTADNIVEKFGKKTFDIILNEPTKLATAKGVTLKKAMGIHETFVSIQEMQEVILYLQDLDISLNMSIKIYKAYGKAARNMMESNPYRLVEDVDGVGFYTADKMAQKMGMPQNSEFRVQAGICYVLTNMASNNGHTYLPRVTLFKDTCKLLELDEENFSELFERAILTLEVRGRIVVLEGDVDGIIMFCTHYETEKRIASKLVNLYCKATTLNADIDADISEYERINSIVLHENQRQAIINGVMHGVNVITGGPGTGKTTIIKAILSIFDKLKLRVQICAPTGRAAKRLSESTGVEAKTIHRLLDLDYKNGKGHFTYNEDTQLECDVVIIDEVSMCDEFVFNALVSAIPRGGRLIMVGDKDQLPSVGAGNVLADIINSKFINVSYLTHIYRQSEESLIVSNAHKINNGEMPILRNNKSDFLFMNIQDAEAIKNTVVELVTARMPNYYNIKPCDIQVLTPMKRGVAGADNLNIELQAAVNPAASDKKEVLFGDKLYRVGDKIIHIINDYDLKWTKGADNGTGIFNGDIGFIIGIDSDNALEVQFEDGRIARYTRDLLEKIKLAYAISVHKSQGSEFGAVVIALSAGSYTILTRNLLYTAVTRAKNTSVIVGSVDNLRRMVANNYTAKRYTLLNDFLDQEAKAQGLYD